MYAWVRCFARSPICRCTYITQTLIHPLTPLLRDCPHSLQCSIQRQIAHFRRQVWRRRAQTEGKRKTRSKTSSEALLKDFNRWWMSWMVLFRFVAISSSRLLPLLLLLLLVWLILLLWLSTNDSCQQQCDRQSVSQCIVSDRATDWKNKREQWPTNCG